MNAHVATTRLNIAFESRLLRRLSTLPVVLIKTTA